MTGDKIFDDILSGVSRIGRIAYVQHRISELRNAVKPRCGNCDHWMKSRSCPLEARGQKPHMNCPPCDSFQEQTLCVKDDLKAELSNLEAEYKSLASCNKPLKDCTASSEIDCAKITTLENEVKELREALLLTIVESRHVFRKGYVEEAGLKALKLSAISEAIQQLQDFHASALLEKKGTKE